MNSIKRLLIGAISVALIISVLPVVGAQASTQDSTSNNKNNSQGTEQAAGWNSTALNNSLSSQAGKTEESSTTSDTLSARDLVYDGFKVYSANSIYYVENGDMVTGWKGVAGWHYFDPDGKMVFDAWRQGADGTWYYINPEGDMESGVGGQYIDGYYIDNYGRYDSSKNDFSIGSGDKIKYKYKDGYFEAQISIADSQSKIGKQVTLTELRDLRKQGKLGVSMDKYSVNGSEWRQELCWCIL